MAQPRNGGSQPPKAEVVARVLADADIIGVRAASEKHQVTERTIRRWREKVRKPPEKGNVEAWNVVADSVRSTRADIDREWRKSLDERIASYLNKLDDCVNSVIVMHPLAIPGVVQAIKALHEMNGAAADPEKTARQMTLIIKKAAAPSKTPDAAPPKPKAKPKP